MVVVSSHQMPAAIPEHQVKSSIPHTADVAIARKILHVAVLVTA
jgi:hypothetical protein